MTSEPPRLVTCIGVEHDLMLLPHFLDHYLSLGIAPDRFAAILNAADAGSPALEQARLILAEAGVAPVETWIGPYTSETMWDRRRALQRGLCAPQDWVISADLDEFHDYPEPLDVFLDRCATMGVDCVQGVFVDRLAPDGVLATVQATPRIALQFPVEAEVALRIAGRGAWHDRRGTVKMMAMRAAILPGRGGHRPWKKQHARYLYGYPLGDFSGIDRPGVRFAVPTRVHHYHWTASLPDRLQLRLATPGVSKAGAEYGRKQLDHIARNGGISLADVSLRGSGGGGDWIRTLGRLRLEGRLRAGLQKVSAAFGRDAR